MSAANALVLPDSRLRDPKATVMADWPVTVVAADGTETTKTIRLELEPVFCINCGKPNGYVPREIMSFVSWLCMPCAETWGEHANNWQTSDQEFWDVVAAEMLDRFGRVLTQKELEQLAERGHLGSALEKLEKESPYVMWNP